MIIKTKKKFKRDKNLNQANKENGINANNEHAVFEASYIGSES